MELQLVCSYIAATIQDPKAAKRAMKQASKIRLFKRAPSERELPSMAQLTALLNG